VERAEVNFKAVYNSAITTKKEYLFGALVGMVRASHDVLCVYRLSLLAANNYIADYVNKHRHPDIYLSLSLLGYRRLL
jgi:hypothetical protein